MDQGSRLARGRMGSETWTFKRVGFWRPAVTIRKPETGEQDVGRFLMDWRRGDLVLPGSARYRWDQVSFWKAEWAWFAAGDNARLVGFAPRNGFFDLRVSMEVRIEPAGEACHDLPLLVLLGWYLLAMAAQDEAAAAATMATMG